MSTLIKKRAFIRLKAIKIHSEKINFVNDKNQAEKSYKWPIKKELKTHSFPYLTKMD